MEIRVAETEYSVSSTGAIRFDCSNGRGAGKPRNCAIVVGITARLTYSGSESVVVLTGHRSTPHWASAADAEALTTITRKSARQIMASPSPFSAHGKDTFLTEKWVRSDWR